MHPFCCVSPISNRDHTPPPPPPPPPSFYPMPAQYLDTHPPQINGHDSKRRDNTITATSTASNNSSANHNQNQNNHSIIIYNSNSNSNSNNQIHRQMSAVDQREVKINDLVGNGICGILYKWVNYGKGWRPRWFVLQDGVLSYYKIHGPHKITLTPESEKGFRVIGDESMRRIHRHRTTSSSPRKPFGEVHLKVSTIRESRSDDKRFSIYTGTKRLHLRAETREDRMVWVDALQAVKDMRIQSFSKL